MKNSINVDQVKKLWLLELIVQNGSFKSAAAQAKVTPSAISQALAALEKNVDKPLIIREKGRITPTPDALAILEVVRPAFAVFDKLKDLGSKPAPRMSWLNFGSYESLAVDILPGLIHRLREKIPNLRLGLRISRTADLLTMVRKGELCSAIVTETDELERFHKIEVGQDRLGIYVSARHPIAQMGPKAVDKFGLGSLAPSKSGLPRYYMRFLKRAGHLKPTVLSESFEALRAATASGVIASVLPHRVASRSPDLLEVNLGEKASGEHGIYVASPLNCDQEEAEFLASESRRLLL